jgi:hypothetical protein
MVTSEPRSGQVDGRREPLPGRMRAAFVCELGPAKGIRVVRVAGGGQRLTLPAGPLYTHDRRILGFVLSLAGVGQLAEAAAVLNHRLAAGDLPARVRAVWPLERTAEARRAVERGLRGRTVLRVAPARS